MSPILIPNISIIVGLYSLFAAVFWLVRPAIFHPIALRLILPPFYSAIILLTVSVLLYAIHARAARPRLGTALAAAMLFVVVAVSAIAISEHALSPGGDQLLLPVTIDSYATIRILLAPVAALAGLLSFSRRFGPRALMAGGAVLLLAAAFLTLKTLSITPILFGLIGIGFILVGNRQYQERLFQY